MSGPVPAICRAGGLAPLRSDQQEEITGEAIFRTNRCDDSMMKTAGLIALIVAAVLCAGCNSTPPNGADIAGNTVRAHYEHHGEWSFGLGCFEKVTGYAYNAGNATVSDVRLNFNLVEVRTGTIRDSRQVFIGPLQAGQSRTFDADLDGECWPDYRVDASII